MVSLLRQGVAFAERTSPLVKKPLKLPLVRTEPPSPYRHLVVFVESFGLGSVKAMT